MRRPGSGRLFAALGWIPFAETRRGSRCGHRHEVRRRRRSESRINTGRRSWKWLGSSILGGGRGRRSPPPSSDEAWRGDSGRRLRRRTPTPPWQSTSRGARPWPRLPLQRGSGNYLEEKREREMIENWTIERKREKGLAYIERRRRGWGG